MDIIKELEDLKSYIAGLSDTNELYLTFPPRHKFGEGATVESVLNKIDFIEEKIKEETEKNKSITCTALIEYIKSYVSFGGPCTDKFIKGLYYYINIINTEIALLKIQSKSLSPKFLKILKRVGINKK